MKMIRNTLLMLIFMAMVNINHAQEITMFTGFWGYQFYQDGNRISKSELESIMSTNKAAIDTWNKSKKQMTGAWLFLGGQIGFLAWQFNRRDNGKSQGAQLAGNIACGIAAIALVISSGNNKKRAILIYNEGLEREGIGSLRFGPTRDGIGWSIRF